jgi:hypothetical protein
MNEKNKEKDYIDQHGEWQTHQYDPGYFTGGRVPVWLKYPGNPKRIGIVFLIVGIFYFLFSVSAIILVFTEDSFILEAGKAIIVLTFSILLILAGIKYLRKSKKSQK